MSDIHSESTAPASASEKRATGISRRTALRGAALAAAVTATGLGPGRTAHAGEARDDGGAAGDGRGKTAIIVGSGFGGSVAALRLGEKGYATTVFERGRRWSTADDGTTFPKLMAPDWRAAWFSDHANINQPSRIVPIKRGPGLIDRVYGNGLDAVFGAGVGGGSLAFGSFVVQPRAEEWDRIFPADVPYSEMASTWFPKAKRELGVSPFPDDLLGLPQWKGARAWLDTAADAGLEVHRHDFAIDWDRVREELAGARTPSVSIGEYVYGTNSGAKLSLDRTYLRRAEGTGNVRVVPMTEVVGISELADGRMRVTTRTIDDDGNEIDRGTADCDVLVVAAGAFYTPALLGKMRATGSLPRLSGQVGKNYGSNGDFIVAQTLQRRDFGAQQGGPGVGVCHSDGPAGPYTIAWEAAPIPRIAGGITTTNLIQVMTDERGSVDIDPDTGEAVLNYPYPRDDNDVDRKGRAAALHFKHLAHDRHGRPDAGVPVWTSTADFGAGCTWHSLGGMVMDGARAHDGAAGAADSSGRVHGYPRMLVVDGSLLPGTAGMVNPALTITAIAERCMSKFLGE